MLSACVFIMLQVGMFCIFDGHHGRNAAEQAKALLPGQLLIHLPAAAVATAAAAADVDTTAEATAGGDIAKTSSSANGAAAALVSREPNSTQAAERGQTSITSSSVGSSTYETQQQQTLLGDHSKTRAGWEAAFLATDGLLSSDDGCTATALLVEAREGGNVMVQVANVGDSEVLMVDMAR
jgi:serine/threonine protein phosphatase PrpC